MSDAFTSTHQLPSVASEQRLYDLLKMLQNSCQVVIRAASLIRTSLKPLVGKGAAYTKAGLTSIAYAYTTSRNLTQIACCQERCFHYLFAFVSDDVHPYSRRRRSSLSHLPSTLSLIPKHCLVECERVASWRAIIPPGLSGVASLLRPPQVASLL